MQKIFLMGARFVSALSLACGAIACGSGVDSASIFGGSTATSGGHSTSGAGVTSSSSSGSGGGTTVAAASTVDLLLAIDNSRSMADKQSVLNLAVPELVDRLVNPRCIDANSQVTAMQPVDGLTPCPAGTHREFAPVRDLHIGVVTSSLGSHGADACPDQVPNSSDCDGATNSSNNDYGHLVTRVDPCKPQVVATYQAAGFLAWDPAQKDTPPGVGDATNLAISLTDLISGAGQIGCGFESQNEGWYRFLGDPSPYKSISVQNGQAVKTGVDDVLLAQRADFLRPTSLLSIVLLTDENDCSAREGGEYYLVEQLSGPNGLYHLPPARSECKKNPNDPCCFSCGQSAGACPTDPVCATKLDQLSDAANLRCFDEKRRFGIDFLYPPARYVNALTQPAINPNAADLSLGGQPGVPNPILRSAGSQKARSAELVFLAGIVGVPWQDIARNPADLGAGFKNAKELTVAGANGITGWDIILGDPDKYVPPADPHMIEQVDPRMTGAIDPANGAAIAPPGSAPNADPINGHEWTIAQRDDLQYACVFDLPGGAARDCSKAETSCDCEDPMNDDPLCSPNPNDNGLPTLQTRAKGYPGIRHLQILRGLKNQGIVASVCPKQLLDKTQADFGYRPAVGAIIERLTSHLGPGQ